MDEQAGVFNAPIVINYRPPGWLLSYLIVTAVGAIICLFFAEIPVLLSLIFAIPIALLAVSAIRELKGGAATLVLGSRDQWTVLTRNNESRPAELYSATVVAPQFLILILQTTDRKRYKFIFTGENLDGSVMRRLRIRLYHPKGAR